MSQTPYLISCRTDLHSNFVHVHIMGHDLTRNFPTVERQKHFLSGQQMEVLNRLKAGSYQFHILVLAIPRKTWCYRRIKPNRILHAGRCENVRRTICRRFHSMNDAAVEFAVVSRRAHSRSDDAPFGDPFACRHFGGKNTLKFGRKKNALKFCRKNAITIRK